MKKYNNEIPFRNGKKAEDLSSLTTQVSNVNTQLAKITYFVTPEMFGTTGGSDDTQIIQSAIDSLTTGGKLVLTKKYNITTINLKSNVIIEGIGQEKCGFVSTSTIIVNIPNGTIRWGLYNFGIWGSNTISTGVKLAGSSGGIADFSIRELYIKSCLVGLHTAYSWAFDINRTRFQDCKTGWISDSQTNQGTITACSFKVNQKAVSLINNNALNFIGCEFAGNNHDGTVPFSLYQSSTINFIGNYIEFFADNTPLMTIGTLTSSSNIAISFRGNYTPKNDTNELFTVYSCEGLDISNNRLGTNTYLVNDVIGNINGLKLEGNTGIAIESRLQNIIPNYNFSVWSSGESTVPNNFTLTSVNSTASRNATDGSFEIVNTTATQGFSVSINESNVNYMTVELETKSSVDTNVYVDFFADGAYKGTKTITTLANTYKKTSIVSYVNGSATTIFRVRFSTVGTHNVKSVKVYRGIVETKNDKKPVFLSSSYPTSGTFLKGEVVTNTSPVAGGYEKWICVTAGSPGTWKGVGLIQA